jgi:hypothetical protein
MKTKIALLTLLLAFSAFAQFPLRVNINASTKTDRKHSSDGMKGQITRNYVTVAVTVKKSSPQPWEKPVMVELYVIGKPVDMEGFTVVGATTNEYTFSKANDNTIKFDSPIYTFAEASILEEVGLKYETYLIVVSDDQGKVVQTRAGRSLAEKEMELIRTLEPRKIYNRDLEIIGTIDDLKKDARKALGDVIDPKKTLQ